MVPQDVVSSILIQLPVKALLRFKSVSKKWCSEISDPYFAKLHLLHSKKTNTHNLRIILRNAETSTLFSLHLNSIDLDNPKKLSQPLDDYEDDGDVLVMGSCNGLLCLMKERRRKIVLWNISTEDYRVLPDVPMELITRAKGDVSTYGFGHDSINDHYKFVMVTSTNVGKEFKSEAIVYNLRTNTWRRGEEISSYIFLSFKGSATFFCEALHWTAVKWFTRLHKWQIFAFDIRTENFRQLDLLDDMNHIVLGELGGCLCVTGSKLNRRDSDIYLWSMKDYGVKESWTILFTFQTYNIEIFPLSPLAYLKYEDKLLMVRPGEYLIWYDQKNNELEKVEQLKNIEAYSADICMESLVQLW